MVDVPGVRDDAVGSYLLELKFDVQEGEGARGALVGETDLWGPQGLDQPKYADLAERKAPPNTVVNVELGRDDFPGLLSKECTLNWLVSDRAGLLPQPVVGYVQK